MNIKIVDSLGNDISTAVKTLLQKIEDKLQRSSKVIQSALLSTTKNHVSTIYPASSHYNPDKVVEDQATDGAIASASIAINIPGITRAYHNIDIKPRFRKHLTIPMHQSAYGRSAKDFNDLIYVKKKNSKEFLARKDGNGLTFMYYLAKSAFQKKDSRLMPTDETFTTNISSRLVSYLQNSNIQI